MRYYIYESNRNKIRILFWELKSNYEKNSRIENKIKYKFIDSIQFVKNDYLYQISISISFYVIQNIIN